MTRASDLSTSGEFVKLKPLAGVETAELKNVGNDGDRLSNGCAVTFLFFLRYVLGYDWSAIVAAGAATLEQTYQILTGTSGGYSELRRCVDGLYPPGSPSGVTANNPFLVFDYYAAVGTIF